MEERTAALEVRLEVLIPTLATKVEVIELRAEMRNLENRLIKWVVGTALALVAVFVTLSAYIATRTDNAIEAQATRTDNAIAAQTQRMDNAIAAQTARTDSAIAAQALRTDNAISELKADIRAMNTRMDRLDARIDRLDEKIDARFDALMAEIRAQGRSAQ